LPNSPSLAFEPVTAQGEVSSTLYWQPECSLLHDGENTTYKLLFIATDDHCPIVKFDTTLLTFDIVQTRGNFDNFLPPNAFSPNGDGINEVFRLSDLPNRNANLPINNCDDVFEYISIHNRAGARVFYSESREFAWNGVGSSEGVYYYVVKYTVTEYNNYLQLFR
jgi:hypothetical protein